jgi:hypothetical protein
MRIFLFATMHTLALGPTQPPIQWETGIKRPELEADHSRPFSAEVKNAWNYISTTPVGPHSVLLS